MDLDKRAQLLVLCFARCGAARAVHMGGVCFCDAHRMKMALLCEGGASGVTIDQMSPGRPCGPGACRVSKPHRRHGDRHVKRRRASFAIAS